jgi:integrase
VRTVAWISPKRSGGYLVRWREGGRSSPIRSKYVRTEEEAKRLKAELDQHALARKVLSATPGIPGWDDASRPLDATEPTYALETYLGAMVRGNRDLRETTREMYLRNVRVHIEGTPLGRSDIRHITPELLTDYWGRLDIGRGALGNVARLLSLAFRRAVRTGLIDLNPLERAPEVRKPSARGRRQVRPLTVDEVERLAGAAATPRDRLEVLVMAYGGLRAGEVGGLRDGDIEWERSRLHLRQQVVRLAGRLEVGDLKTSAARRVVTLPRSVVDDLRAFLDENHSADDGRVFHGVGGSMRDHIRINRSVQRAADRAGIKTHAHALRHTAVSLWIAHGASPIDVQHMVGHTDVQTTLAQYAHMFSWGGEALAESMERRREAHRNGG